MGCYAGGKEGVKIKGEVNDTPSGDQGLIRVVFYFTTNINPLGPGNNDAFKLEDLLSSHH